VFVGWECDVVEEGARGRAKSGILVFVMVVVIRGRGRGS
jgi:hypothetical protein